MDIKELVLILQKHLVNNQIIYVTPSLNTQLQTQQQVLLKILNFLGLLRLHQQIQQLDLDDLKLTLKYILQGLVT